VNNQKPVLVHLVAAAGWAARHYTSGAYMHVFQRTGTHKRQGFYLCRNPISDLGISILSEMEEIYVSVLDDVVETVRNIPIKVLFEHTLVGNLGMVDGLCIPCLTDNNVNI
jgi:hypothetical protein